MKIIKIISIYFSALKKRVNWPVSGNVSVSLNSGLILIRKNGVFLLSVIAGLVAFLLTQQYAETRVAEERRRVMPQGGLVEILVASRDLQAGERVSAETISVRQVPADWSLPTNLSPLDFSAVNQQTLRQSLNKGAPLTGDALRATKSTDLKIALPPGYRAISIPVDEVSSVGGLIKPGDRVDLWAPINSAPLPEKGAVFSVPSEKREFPRQVRLIAENLQVIATGQRTELDGNAQTQMPAYSSLTLAVPAHISSLVLGGQFQGKLGLALRGPNEVQSKTSRSQHGSGRMGSPVEILIGGIEGALQ